MFFLKKMVKEVNRRAHKSCLQNFVFLLFIRVSNFNNIQYIQILKYVLKKIL